MIPEFDEFPVFYFTNALAVVGPGDLRVGARGGSSSSTSSSRASA